MNLSLRSAAVAALTLVAFGACSSGASDSGFSGNAPADNASTGGGAGSSGGDNGGGASGGLFLGDDGGKAALPPEIKVENTYESPVATGNVVWIANPASGHVTYIDAATFNVQTVLAGNAPTYLAAVPDPSDDVAIVLNVVSQDATLLRRDSKGNITSTTFASTADANSWAISSSGRWAIAWTDATLVSNADATQGFESIAVMDLSSATASGTGTSTILGAVGFRPSQVAFSGDDTAFAVTQDGISSVNLGASPPATTAQYPLAATGTVVTSVVDASSDARVSDGGGSSTDASNDSGAADVVEASSPVVYEDAANGTAPVPTGTPDVSFTPDGHYALVRQDGLSSITVISLGNGVATAVPLPDAPTDLSLSPKGDFAVAVLRDISTVAILPLPGIVTNPSAITLIPISGVTIGRAIVAQDDNTLLLFTTVGDFEQLTVLTLQSTTYRTIELHAPVLAVFPTGDAKYAVVLHSVTPTAGSNIKGAFSLVPLAASLPVEIVSVTAEPMSVAIAPTNDRVVISLRDDPSTTYGLDLALLPSLQVISQTLASPPIAAGIAAGAGRGYAAQDDSEGRITFVDLYAEDGGAPGAARTISGFELAARIIDGRDQ